MFCVQAEDGIRDLTVTGVQTCALPIFANDAVDPHPHARILSVTSDQPVNDGGDGDTSPDWLITGELTVQLRRSEERRVGKSVDLGGRRIIKKKKNRTS